MKRVAEQSTLDLPMEIDSVETKKVIESNNLIDLPLISINLVDEQKDIVSKHPSCDHTGGCGSRYHQGNGWCWYCSICNPSNPKAY